MIIPPTANIENLLDYFSFAMWLIYFLTFLSIIVMRYREPFKSKERPFRNGCHNIRIFWYKNQARHPWNSLTTNKKGLAPATNCMCSDCTLFGYCTYYWISINGLFVSNNSYFCRTHILCSICMARMDLTSWTLSKTWNISSKILWSCTRRYG